MKITERSYDKSAARRLVEEGFLPALAKALAARGIESSADMSNDWAGMIPPGRMNGIERAVDRLVEARRNGEHVVVVADYDCDGATACAVALRGLKMMGLSASYFVPDRVVHGYGLSPSIVEIVSGFNPKPDLIITVDNGMSSWEAVARASELGIDVIVTDHHLPGEKIPDAVSIVNPNASDCTFPSKNLAGVGVVYYVLLSLRAKLRGLGVYTKLTQPRLDALVDLVALGTVADVVKLDKNNRILVSQGLKRIRSGKTHPGIEELFRVAGKSCSEATVRDFGFAIGPRINAAGRLSTMDSGIECLLTDDQEKARLLAVHLNSYNKERKSQENEMQEAAKITLGKSSRDQRSIVLYDDDYAEGIVGLLASRIKESEHKPVFAFARSDSGRLKGSGRSIPGIHLRDVLCLVDKEIPGRIIKFGGHAMAAGLTLEADGLEDFRTAFEKVIREHASEELFTKEILTDGPLAPNEITEELCEQLSSNIWGQGFEQPIYSNEFEVFGQRILKDAHSKFTVKLDGRSFDAIFFRNTDSLPRRAKLAYMPQINEFNGRKSIQLQILGWQEPL